MDIRKVAEWPNYFDALIIDVWGIVSDGYVLSDSAQAFLEKVDLTTILISNTPFRNQELALLLKKDGFISG